MKVTKVLLDTDIGDDIDDAWALSLCIRHPKIRLVGVTTVRGDTEIRAALCRLLLESANIIGVEVVAGSRDALDGTTDPYRPKYADALEHDEQRLKKGRTNAIRFMAEVARRNPGLSLITIGPLTNAARLALEFPREFATITRHVMMCGDLIPDKEEPEYNAGCDPRATQIALSTKVPKIVVGLDVTLKCGLLEEDLGKLWSKGTPLATALGRMTRLWQGKSGIMPIMHDPLAVMSAVETGIAEFKPMRVCSDDEGRFKKTSGRANVKFAVEVNPDLLRRKLVEIIW